MSDAYTFERPHRRLGIRLYNAVGGALGKMGVSLTSLDEETLLKKARRMTGLSDFGSEEFREGLRVLMKAYEEEAELSPFGRILARASTLNLLCNRLRVQHLIHEHPEILDAPIRRPLFIAALPRTGTTLLYNLLAQDPAARPLLMWEAILPVSPARNHRRTDPRIRRTERTCWALNLLAPNLSTVHPIDPRGPEECSRLQMNTFVTSYAVMEHFVPSYQQWYFRQPEEVLQAAYRDYRRQLQVLQWQRPVPGHWVLKSPAHLLSMGPLMKVFSDASVVQLHRDPHKVIPSLCSLFAVYQGMSSDRVRCQQLGAQVLALCVEGLRRSYQARESAPRGQVYDLKYPDLMEDPIEAVRRIYEHFGYEMSAEFQRRMEAWIEGNPKDRHGKHRYDLEQFGLSRELIEGAMQTYCQQYGIVPENRERDTTARLQPEPSA
jgi:hypothetical protein